MRASLYSANLHYGGGFSVHTASSGSIAHLAELYLCLSDGSFTGVGGVRTNIAYLTGIPEQTLVGEATAAVAGIEWSRPAADLLAGLTVAGTRLSAPVRSMIDMALHDLLAKHASKPLATFLAANASSPSFATNQTLFWSTFDDFLSRAARYVARGFRKLKVRVGIGSFDDDVRRIGALRERFGGSIEIAADANGVWSPDDARKRLIALAPFKLAYFEQPIAAGNWDSLTMLADESPIPVMLDESIVEEKDVDRVCAYNGRLLAHLKLVKLGGVGPTIAAARRLKASGVPFMVGQMNEGGVCTAAALHVAAAVNPVYAELYGADGLVDDPAPGVTYREGNASVPKSPGLGIAFDPTRATLIREY